MYEVQANLKDLVIELAYSKRAEKARMHRIERSKGLQAAHARLLLFSLNAHQCDITGVAKNLQIFRSRFFLCKAQNALYVKFLLL